MYGLCKKCGKAIEVTGRHEVYCSKCRGLRRHTPAKKIKAKLKICETCGMEYLTTYKRARFCSDVCRKDFHYHRVVKTKLCKGCGKEFEASNKREYCTPYCALTQKRLRLKEATK